jgi:electron transfer flavoprotein beta subunit
MPYNIAVLAKQVPDTQNITGEAMKEDGTVNRDALPRIFNPEDLNALEMGLSIRDEFGGCVTVITMGPPAAAELLREALMRGADHVVLLTDRRFAVADTLATAYTLCQAIETIGDIDIILCGRQAIDGDTAQIGPQVAGKLSVPQITYAEGVLELGGGGIRAKRNIEGGYEIVEAPLPALLTVTSRANEPRPRRAKLVMRFKKARTPTEIERILAENLPDRRYLPPGDSPQQVIAAMRDKGLLIPEWNVEAIQADAAQCGFAGSPTRVMNIERVVLMSTEHDNVEPTRAGVAGLMRKLVEEHIIG